MSQVSQTLDKVRQQLENRGSRTIRALGRTFRALDSYDRNHKVSRDEFEVGLRENGVQLTKNESDALFSHLDKDGDGTVNFDEFLVGIRGKPNARRGAMIDKAFLKFDKDCNGYIDVNDLQGVYNCREHPKVKRGEMTETQALGEFLNNFDGPVKDGKITKEEWNEYYAAVSSSIDNDEHFVMLMRNAWKID